MVFGGEGRSARQSSCTYCTYILQEDSARQLYADRSLPCLPILSAGDSSATCGKTRLHHFSFSPAGVHGIVTHFPASKQWLFYTHFYLFPKKNYLSSFFWQKTNILFVIFSEKTQIFLQPWKHNSFPVPPYCSPLVTLIHVGKNKI